MVTKRTSRKTASSGQPADVLKPGSDASRSPIHDQLKALEEMQRLAPHSHLFDNLLGLHSGSGPSTAKAYKLPTFEDLFDERVERALERRGHTQSTADLREEIKRLDERLRRLERLLVQRAKSKPAKG